MTILADKIKEFIKEKKPEELDLSSNNLESGFEPLTACKGIKILDLSCNKISSVDSLAPLKEIEQLRVVNLEGNPIAEEEMYRDTVFDLLPLVDVIDNVNRDGENLSFSDDLDEPYTGESSEEEEYGLEVLQRNEDLEDDEDEEDYEPVEDEDDDDEDLDEDEEENGVNDVADLSHENVDGKTRIAGKKAAASDPDDDAPPNKVRSTEDGHENSVNGSSVKE